MSKGVLRLRPGTEWLLFETSPEHDILSTMTKTSSFADLKLIHLLSKDTRISPSKNRFPTAPREPISLFYSRRSLFCRAIFDPLAARLVLIMIVPHRRRLQRPHNTEEVLPRD